MSIIVAAMSKEENIRVSARIRPCSNLHANVQSCLTCDPATGSISVTAPDKQKQYTFNSVLSETSNQVSLFFKLFDIWKPFFQEFVYAKVAEHVVDGFLNGINGTIFAYGQTGSGKTFTMIGPEVNGTFDHEKRGIIPRSLEAIFQVLESQKQKVGCLNFFIVTIIISRNKEHLNTACHVHLLNFTMKKCLIFFLDLTNSCKFE